MFFFKFTFIFTILAFLSMTATALPVAFSTGSGAPGSLLGRTYMHRAVVASPAAVAAREDNLAAAPAARRAPVAVADADLEDFKPMKRSERFQRRISARSRLSAAAVLDTQN
ncbi:hypothetical protein D9611_004120 [Ephemerocybe angulata]|uniref:Uncharacterized protein n=1 Tax=Ephemerocybe angulata TaxID=980116 RepID=A0A8H5BK10_9AGAR|nr:hypothetical protein D9611_004120 [Tulosesus angulatus]